MKNGVRAKKGDERCDAGWQERSKGIARWKQWEGKGGICLCVHMRRMSLSATGSS